MKKSFIAILILSLSACNDSSRKKENLIDRQRSITQQMDSLKKKIAQSDKYEKEYDQRLSVAEKNIEHEKDSSLYFGLKQIISWRKADMNKVDSLKRLYDSLEFELKRF